MAGPYDSINTDPNSGIFFANNPNINMQLRQRMALAMMANKKKLPTTLGEGIASAGGDIADALIAKHMEQADLAQQQAAKDLLSGGDGGPSADASPPTRAADLPPPADSQPPAVAAAPLQAAPAVPVEQPVLPAAPARSMAVGPDPGIDAPIRTNPDGTLAGNQTSPMLLPPPTGDPQAAVPMPPQRIAETADPNNPPTPEQMANAKARMAAIMMAQQQRPGAVPPPNPTAAGGPGMSPSPPVSAPTDQPESFDPNALRGGAGADTLAATQSPGTVSDIPKAPPPQQMAQATSLPPAGYVMKEPVTPTPPPQIPQSRRELQLGVMKDANPYMAPLHAREVQAREFQQGLLNKKYEADLKRFEADRALVEGQKATAPERAQSYEKGQRAAEQEKRFGGLTQEFHQKAIEESTKAVAPLPQSSAAINTALNAVKSGIFSGVAAHGDQAKARVMAAMGFPVDPRISMTQQFEAAMGPIFASARVAQAGNANISNQDIVDAKKTVAGDITLDEKTFTAVLTRLRSWNEQAAIQHQSKLETLAGNDPQAQQMLFGLHGTDMARIVPPEKQDLLRKNPTPEVMAEFDRHYHTPGLARRILGGR